jgi:hypothetical protein
MDLEEISAHMEIRQTLARYCRGVDPRDVELLRSVYHPDAVDDHGMFNGLGVDFAGWVLKALATGGWSFTTHQITNVPIELSKDRRSAGVETYYVAFHPGTEPGTELSTMFTTGGRYLDRFELRSGTWKIAARLCTVDWAWDAPGVAPWPGISAFAQIGGRDDPSYHFLSGSVKCEGRVGTQ